MKTSTRKSSSSKGSSPGVAALKGVQGIVFFKKEYKPLHVTVAAWVRAGKPENCFVYDGVHQLLSSRIPIVDAIEVEGRWIRTHIPKTCPDTKYKRVVELKKKRVRASAIPLKPSQFITSADAQKRKLR